MSLNRCVGVAAVCAAIVTACSAAPSASNPEAVEAEARQFTEGYAADLRAHDAAAVAARYSRAGAHLVRPGQSRLEPYDSIVRIYTERWSGPAAFEWGDLSYAVLGEDAVVVNGTFRWEQPGGGGVAAAYTALLAREDGELRIRLEHESFDDLPPAACASAAEPCDLPLAEAARSRYVGEYEQDGVDGRIRVLEQDGGLAIQRPGAPAMRLLYRGGGEFRFASGPGARLLFTGPAERATSFVIFSGVLGGAARRVR